MTSTNRPLPTALLVALLVFSGLAAFAFPAAGSHGAENGNYTVSLPNEEDHYPGDQGGLASINHLAAATGEAFDKVGAPNEINMHWIIITQPAIDFTECTTEDTRTFVIDEGHNDSGTSSTPGEDTQLVPYRKNAYFQSDRIMVEFYQDGSSPAAPSDAPPTVHPIDEIVAAQADCYYMPEEPGWYQINGYLNGTNANGDFVELTMPSHYFYICVCSSEEEAREKLGPPPSEQDDGGSSTPTPTESGDGPTATPTPTQGGGATPTPTQGGGGATPTPTQGGGGGGGGTATPTHGGGGSTATATTTQGGGGGATATQGGGGGGTPTLASGPGFGAIAAVLALLGGALLAHRRR